MKQTVNEQCHQYNECDTYAPFLNQNKPVFNFEYQLGSGNTYCSEAKAEGIQTKRCAGSPSDGICTSGSSWENCFSPFSTPFPLKQYLFNGTFAPSTLSPSPSPTNYPTKRRKPTHSPTAKPTKKPRTPFPTK